MNLQEMVCGGMDWIKLAQYGDRWQALVVVIMNQLASQEGFAHGASK
jgi:hypothetical protein